MVVMEIFPWQLVHERFAVFFFVKRVLKVVVIQRVHKDCKNKHVNRAIILFIQNPHYLRYFSILLNAVY